MNNPDPGSPNTVPATCQQCGQPFQAHVYRRPLDGETHVPLCSRCSEEARLAVVAKIEAEKRFVREQEWQQVCPALYRQCDPAKLPSDQGRAALSIALMWAPDQGGLSFISRESGQGKTRLAFAALRPHFLAGINVHAVLSGQFAVECAGKYDNQLDEWLSPLRNARLLLLDDLGKDKPSERINAALFSLIEHRCAHQRPFVFTSNYNGEELATRFGDHGPYIVRRLREFCRTILL